MKNIILILIVILIVLFVVRMINQQKQIDAIPDATLTEGEDATDGVTEKAEGTKTVTLTSTPSGMTQESTGDVAVNLDETYLTFYGYGPGKSHEGTFETFEAEIAFDEVNSVVSGEILIEASSVKTDTEALDGHLQSKDFFEVETYPTISYVFEDIIVNSGSGEASAQGTLAFHGVTKKISAPVTLLPNGFNAKFNISLSEFGIEYTGVNDEVTLEVQVVLQ